MTDILRNIKLGLLFLVDNHWHGVENDGGDGVVTFVPSRVDTVSSLENLQWGRSLPLLIISIMMIPTVFTASKGLVSQSQAITGYHEAMCKRSWGGFALHLVTRTPLSVCAGALPSQNFRHLHERSFHHIQSSQTLKGLLFLKRVIICVTSIMVSVC